MTKKGSLAYYGCAVVLGSFFVAATYYPYLKRGLPKSDWPKEFIVTFFFTFLLTLIPHLLSAFLLRRLAVRFDWTGALPWMAGGTAISFASVYFLGVAGNFWQTLPGTASWIHGGVFFLFVGPWFALKQPLWLLLPPGIVTSFFLWRTHRAFNPPSPN
jgi:hypothetical protein